MINNDTMDIWNSVSSEEDEVESHVEPYRQESMSSTVRGLDALARHLSTDFPLHSPSELRRAILQASEDIWPEQGASEIIDQARLRLGSSSLP